MPPSEPARTTAGIALTADILATVAPLVEGEPTDIVIEAFAAAMMATLVTAGATTTEQKTVLRRFADRILGFAGAL